MSGRHIAFPFRIGPDGRSATPASLDEHVRGEIIQLLLTNPGERPFLPSFGGGVRRLVFERNDDVAANMVKALLLALVAPIGKLKDAEAEGDYTTRLALMEDMKLLPAGAVWDYYCLARGVPVGTGWLDDVQKYERAVLSRR